MALDKLAPTVEKQSLKQFAISLGLVFNTFFRGLATDCTVEEGFCFRMILFIVFQVCLISS